ncbi:eukaryotic translation initiation factor 4E [Lobosporangium transversale]|uniref:Translation initiation factor eIF 4e-like domain-containing protein n=1 Tax=Lobosporangium transversale TaxID=64571 RepID=A0A1Y2GL62_9FUNG|nr:translation initiation factor eIF 4e-like domain-containing protein [Lobosporangium transversale]KAF9917327.1 eukaryotic translation initiation factor 4E [Lobosporangium transversale]ORZ14352.1 translation initiation factor eIF 4e-like domain-containing protein [Lobosporangium transversale]|eukprot:XP_021880830.1 translation initiation factor eIF 4e-like domain-containing protein [Lobosporangium transversale]
MAQHDSDNNNTLAVPTENTKYVTVFNDPVNFNVKHPLNNSWTLWFDNPGKKTNPNTWEQSLKELITVETVEDFWGVYNNVMKACDLAINSNYHLFKQGIKPMWEDPANKRGGKWSIQLPRNKTISEIDNIWLYTMLACIGEAFEHENEVCGAVVSVRKAFFRIALWTRSSDNQEIVMNIGRTLKRSANIHGTLEFQSHHDSTPKAEPWTV